MPHHNKAGIPGPVCDNALFLVWQDRAGKTAGMVSAFCSQLGWSDLEMLVAKFQGGSHTCSGVAAAGHQRGRDCCPKTAAEFSSARCLLLLICCLPTCVYVCWLYAGRIKSGVKEDIVALTEIPGVRGYRARLLYKAGLRTPEAVAACDISKLTDVLVAGGWGWLRLLLG
jgi:hypothetical protein